MKQALQVFFEDWADVSGNPAIGKHLKALLHEAGFDSVLSFASYENFPTAESIKKFMGLAASGFEERAFIDRVVGRGSADETKMSEYSRAFRKFGEHPDSFVAVAHGEAVGWKP